MNDGDRSPPGPFWQFDRFTLSQRQREGDLVLLREVTLSVPRGRLYLLLGESGGGKSSLFRMCAGLIEPRQLPPRTEGRFTCLGVDLATQAAVQVHRRTAMVLQDEGLLDDLTPRENVELALRAAGRSRRLAPALLAEVGLDPPPHRVDLLSGGMRKRLAVARALAADPEVLLCDEPVAGLDPRAARQIAELLRRSHGLSAGRTTVVITHDVAAFEGLYDAVLVLDRQQQSLRVEGPDHQWRPTDVSPNLAVEPEASPTSDRIRQAFLGLGSLSETLWQSLRQLPPFEFGQTLRSVVTCVVSPAPFVAMAGAVIGGLATFFALRNNPIHGGLEAELVQGTGKVLLAVLVPLLSGLFFTARIAAGATARIGTMKRNQQIAALGMMGIDPAAYLLTPLVWGMVIAMPLAALVSGVMAAVAAWLAAETVTSMSGSGWASAFFQSVDPRDAQVVLLKSVLSGYLVALTCYHLGTGPKRSGDDVGNAVNTAIVVAMGLVLAVHAGLTLVFYV
jgi:ABC-type multidrug transport system ATPase subunit/ABC-type transporter Mla maintaining outer membrane lipid asymmetry permease subunit MlaE